MAMTMRGPVAAVIELSRTWLLPSASLRRPVWIPAIGVAYIATIAILGGLHGGHLLLGLLCVLDAYNEKTRTFLRTFLPCIATGALYDSFRYFLHPVIAGRIHVTGPYGLERAWFGVGGHTLNEVFALHHWAIADLATGFAYLIYVAEYLGLALLLFFRGQVRAALLFARGFLVVNMLGFITYLVYPAAPPWYVAAHGFGPAEVDALPSPAAAERFDALLGTHVMSKAYGHSVEVFGAIPSLHAAYPTLAVLLVWRTPTLRWLRAPTAMYALLMWFAAVYLQHHYVIDVLVGALYAVLTAVIVRAWERRTP